MQKTGVPAQVRETIWGLIQGKSYDPHRLLGLHPSAQDGKVIRIWRPGAQTVHIELFDQVVKVKKIHDAGLFQLKVPDHTEPSDYRVYHQSGLLGHDPYAFLPTVGDLDQYLFRQGTHYEIYHKLGANLCHHHGVDGVKFAVWAPNAKTVALVADFNHWDGRANPMRSLGSSGWWELFVPGIKAGEKYKFEIRARDDRVLLKSDPFAKQMELRPATASIVADLGSFDWKDSAWIEGRKAEWDHAKAVNIYEVHLGSWRRPFGQFMNYRTLAHELADYCLDMGFTHVELLPVMEHPLDESWGYQVTGFYAPTSRFGSLQDFQYFINHLHGKGLGVIIDWVPGHFPEDQFALAEFDGTALYEHQDPKQGWHPHWQTLIFNYGRHEVSNFLIANALYWIEQLHVDGLRVDAVASMLYLDYGREEGEWVANKYGGKENLEAIEFMKHLNSVVHERNPGVLMIAEESTSFAGVTSSVACGGLGFDMKWNMGWMNDTLRYFSRDPIFRSHHQQELTFGLLYAFSERFCLVLSHDEVVHGKRSLLAKMPGDMWQQFANLRLLLSFMVCQPGKNLLFMGGELGQWTEWSCTEEIGWNLLEYESHRGIQNMVRDLNHLVLDNPALWERDFEPSGFDWVDFHDRDNGVISYRRQSSRGDLLCVHHFTPQYHTDYFVRLESLAGVEEVFSSDANYYGGSEKGCPHPQMVHDENGAPIGIRIQLAPLATQIFRLHYTH